eukprot:g1044.t1
MNKCIFLLLFLVHSVHASDFKYACNNNSAYNGNKLITAFGQSSQKSCDTWFTDLSASGQIFNGYVWAANSTCTGNVNPLPTAADSNGNTAAGYVNKLANEYGCCTDQKGLCWVDYSKICKNPNNYVGSNTVSGMGTTCDTIFPNLQSDNSGTKTFAGVNFATLTCKDISTRQGEVISYDKIDTSCCSDGKSLCYQDLSKLCKNPSDFDGTAKWDKKGSGNTNVCNIHLSTQLVQFAKLNLTLNDVDSNTCDDYVMEKGDGSGKENLLRWIHDHSACCGTGGAAKNGCPAALDTSFGPKSISFGAISFILPMFVMAYFH